MEVKKVIGGYVTIVLHSHMPFVRHPEIEDALEERWLFEAISESYIPLIEIYDNLLKDNINFKITMSITPTLMTMLEDEYLNKKYLQYLEKSIEFSEKEILRTRSNVEINKLAQFYNKRFNKLRKIYIKYDYNLMNAFRKFDRAGCLEVITSSATHGLLPLLTTNPETVKAQIVTGIQTYIDSMGHSPKGIWLPECAYTYSIDSILKEYGIQYFISESKGILNAAPKPRYGTYAPISTPNGVCAFARDIESSYQVWSDFNGYPGDFNYREFYRDAGHELPLEYVRPYINKDGIRVDTGIKYYKITGKTENKEYYNRHRAISKAKEHGNHFVNCRRHQINYISKYMDQPPIITCPYDTELFGHWWFEGPDFLEALIRKSFEEEINYNLTTPSEYLNMYPIVQCSSPSPSSWGENGDFSVWLNPSNQWIYKELHRCAYIMTKLASTYENATDIQRRALNQAARELMLAEASDWPFIIKNDTAANYAVRQVNVHIERFNRLYEDIIKNSIDLNYISLIENLDNIFKNVDYRVYARNSQY
jgi:1,4-alpha-glucan branching enzyme